MNAVKNQPDIHRRTLGVTFTADQQANVTLWAPQAKQVALLINNQSAHLPLVADSSGYWHLETDQLKPGDTYAFVLDDERLYADPASLIQPQGIFGSSQAVDTNKFYWEDSCWVNPPLDEYIIFELNVRSFSPEGTFDAVIKKLGDLKKLGVNALLIKHASFFPDAANVFFPYAVQAEFGGPAQFQHLINSCHFDGIAIIMDVNYAELSKSNNSATARYTNDGRANRTRLNFTHDAHREAGRRYIIDNALMWFRDFHIDALQLNSIYALPDSEQILNDIRTYTNQLTAVTDVHHCLLVENEWANKSLTEGTSAETGEQKGAIETGSNTGQYDSYCSDHQPTKLSIKTYRENFLYDEQFSSVLRELFSRRPETDQSKVIF